MLPLSIVWIESFFPVLGSYPVPQESVGAFEEPGAPVSLPHHTHLGTFSEVDLHIV